MPRCKECKTFYRNMDHSVYDCAQAGGQEAKRIMAEPRSMSDHALDVAQQIADQQADEITPATFIGATDVF